jgi:hypothetical protein
MARAGRFARKSELCALLVFAWVSKVTKAINESISP